MQGDEAALNGLPERPDLQERERERDRKCTATTRVAWMRICYLSGVSPHIYESIPRPRVAAGRLFRSTLTLVSGGGSRLTSEMKGVNNIGLLGVGRNWHAGPDR